MEGNSCIERKEVVESEEVKAVRAKLYRKGKFHLGKFCGRMSGSCCAGGPGLRGTLSAGSQASTLDQA